MEQIEEIIATVLAIILIVSIIVWLVFAFILDMKTAQKRTKYKKTLNEDEKAIINNYLDEKATLKDLFKKKEIKK